MGRTDLTALIDESSGQRGSESGTDARDNRCL